MRRFSVTCLMRASPKGNLLQDSSILFLPLCYCLNSSYNNYINHIMYYMLLDSHKLAFLYQEQ